MMKFHIVDEELNIIDSGDNMLSLRMDCKSMNDRLGGKCEVLSTVELEAKRTAPKSRDEMIEMMVNRDIDSIRNDVLINDYSFLNDILLGNGWTQYNNLTDEQVLDNYNDMMATKKENDE